MKTINSLQGMHNNIPTMDNIKIILLQIAGKLLGLIFTWILSEDIPRNPINI